MSVQAVQEAKDECLALGIDITGPCGALAITNRAAWKIPGAQLHLKTSGEQCNNRAADILVVDHQVYDVLINAGGVNGQPGTGNVPSWQLKGPIGNVNDERPPFPLEPPTPEPPIPSTITEALDEIRWLCTITYNQTVANGADLAAIKKKLGI
jgi:hypothetical protein